MRRKIPIAQGEYYHLLNRGNNKQNIFKDDRDRARLLFLLLFLQGTVPLFNASQYVSYFTRHRVFNISEKMLQRITGSRQVELASFVLMPNHFHLLAFEKEDGGISQYMQRVLNAYTKYFNTRYERSGHLFQGPYKAIRMKDNRQLLYLSAYIHRNPKGLGAWKKNEHTYPWSSFQDYTQKNRWRELLENKIIIEQFESGKEYRKFVDTSGAKEIDYDFGDFRD